MKNTAKSITLMTVTSLLAAIPLANAGHDNFSSNYQANNGFTIKAKVLDVSPNFIYETVRVPKQNCYSQQVTHTHYSDGNRAGRMLIGGIVGGVIGNNIGRGKSRKASAVVGALIGSQIGNRIADNNAYASQHTSYEPRCQTQYVSESQRRIDGYNVTYRFRGRVLTTQMPYHPGKRIKLNVSVTPVIN